MTKIKIRFIKKYNQYKKGYETDKAHQSVVDRLLSEGIVELIKDKKEVIPGFEIKEGAKTKRPRRTKEQMAIDKLNGK